MLAYSRYFILTILICSSLFAPGLAQEGATNGVDAEVGSPVAVIESISVAATRHRQGETLISEYVVIDELATATGSLSEALALQPSVSLNGQPGLFQTLNIRGLARQRVQSFLNGMRLTSERRAGVSASFIDPLLLGGVEVVQGPASTYYGSGALAGALQLLLREDVSPWLSTGYASDGNERNFAAGAGNANYSAGIALRQRNDGNTVEGDTKFDRFDQLSAYYQRQFEVGDYSVDWQLVGSRAEDIGKDNSQFPLDRIVLYPEENHLLGQLKLSGTGDWAARLSLHYQDLLTRETQAETQGIGAQMSEVANRSMDIGFALEDRWQVGQLSGQYGFDYFGRRGVNAREDDFVLSRLRGSTQSLDDGEENESAVFATANRDFDYVSVHLGGRWTYFTQNDSQSDSISQSLGSYFLTVRKPIGDWDLSLSYGTSSRFASLTERLFIGTTGRGQVAGNPNLLPEDSSELDIGIEYQGERLALELHRFEMDIDAFIERVTLDENTLSYRNLVNGDLRGWQYRVALFPANPGNSWQLEFSGQRVTGESDSGNTLIDIPAARHQVDLFYSAQSWSLNMSLRRRLDKPSFGATERALQAANIGALNLRFELSERWQMQAGIENLFDESYFSSADALSTLAIGREFTLGFHFR